MVKKGKQLGRQRYKCLDCKRQFQSKKRKQKFLNKLWREYVYGKQTALELGKKYQRSSKWILQQLNKVEVNETKVINIQPRPVVVVADATFFERTAGLLIFREPNLKQNLIWQEIPSETIKQYALLKLKLEYLGFTIKAVVLDGRKGIRTVFQGLPIQMCHFHQAAIIRRHLTNRPKLLPAIELREIVRQLTKSNENDFGLMLNKWHNQWQEFLKERTVDFITHKWFYTHKRLRSAYRSLKTNLPYLFTYQKYPELIIPNTTNSLDGYVTTLKKHLGNHQGMRKEKRTKIINHFLNSMP